MTGPLNSTAGRIARVLVIDDEADIIELVTYNLSRAGYKITPAADAEEALGLLKGAQFDLIILDLMLPGLQGIELCGIIRNNPKTAHVPVIMLTAKGEIDDKVRGLQTGADDYLTKPFSPRELVARVNALLRRAENPAMRTDVMQFGSLRIDRERSCMSKRGVDIHLSPTEFALLLYFIERKGRVFSREQLLDAVWRDDAFVEPRTVDVHIRRLRMQIEDDPARPLIVKTRRGVGYYVDGE